MAVNELNNTPNASRLHIAIFGRRNSGKSSLINAVSNQQTALVSDVAGTTTDPVYRPMELLPIGPCVLIDTAGFDDEGTLGEMRVEKTREVISKTDLAVLVIGAQQSEFEKELKWLEELQEKNIPVLLVVNKLDMMGINKESENTKPEADEDGILLSITESLPEKLAELSSISVSAKENINIDKLKEKLVELAPAEFELDSITSHLINEGDHVLLVAPQDIQAPKGRLILPQVQTIRDLLDHRAAVTMITTDRLEATLELFKNPPKLIITDSQVFAYVKERCPKETMLTSFSVLMARYKGDIDEFVKGAGSIDSLNAGSHILILEACTHNPLDGATKQLLKI
ncbi:MAG: [FeFe] hydrogenase H-cluster maturation GTPase HydF [Proteocatella sp.]